MTRPDDVVEVVLGQTQVLGAAGAGTAIGPPPGSTRARTAYRRVGEPASVRTVGDRLVVAGDVDLDGRGAIGPALLAAAATSAPCVVYLTAVRCLNSAGVALLAEAAALEGPRLSIVVAPNSARARVCALTGLTAMVAAEPAPSPTSGTLVG